jgi:hypothetical protein
MTRTWTLVCHTRAATNAAGVVDDVDVGRFTTDIWGMDATVRWRPLRQTMYRNFLGRSRVDMEPARPARRATAGVRVLRSLGTTSSRGAGSPERDTTGPTARLMSSTTAATRCS